MFSTEVMQEAKEISKQWQKNLDEGVYKNRGPDNRSLKFSAFMCMLMWRWLQHNPRKTKEDWKYIYFNLIDAGDNNCFACTWLHGQSEVFLCHSCFLKAIWRTGCEDYDIFGSSIYGPEFAKRDISEDIARQDLLLNSPYSVWSYTFMREKTLLKKIGRIKIDALRITASAIIVDEAERVFLTEVAEGR